MKLRDSYSAANSGSLYLAVQKKQAATGEPQETLEGACSYTRYESVDIDITEPERVWVELSEQPTATPAYEIETSV